MAGVGSAEPVVYFLFEAGPSRQSAALSRVKTCGDKMVVLTRTTDRPDFPRWFSSSIGSDWGINGVTFA